MTLYKSTSEFSLPHGLHAASPAEQKLKIGSVRLDNRFILSPMAGMFRSSLRAAYRQLGCAMVCIGAIDANSLANSSTNKLVNIVGTEETICREERPACIQLIGAEIDDLAEAARKIERIADIIDLNFSCPLKRVINAGGGAGLLRHPELIERMVRAVVKAVSVPVTAKIRIGIDGNDIDVSDIAKRCQEAGAAALCVHARTANQMYCGPVHWEWIAKVKQAVDIPVIGNGGVNTPYDAVAMLEKTKCDFVAIGKASFANPLIFLQANQYITTGGFRKPPESIAILKLLLCYGRIEKQIGHRSRLSFLRRRCREFFRIQDYLKKVQCGNVKLD